MENVTCVFFKTADARPTLADIRDAVADIPKLQALVYPAPDYGPDEWMVYLQGEEYLDFVVGMFLDMGTETATSTQEVLGGGPSRLYRQLALQWLDGNITIIYHNDDIENSVFATEVERRLQVLVKGIIYHPDTGELLL